MGLSMFPTALCLNEVRFRTTYFGGLRIPAKVVIAQAGCRSGRDFSLAAVMLNRRACSYRRALEEVSNLRESSCLGFGWAIL